MLSLHNIQATLSVNDYGLVFQIHSMNERIRAQPLVGTTEVLTGKGCVVLSALAPDLYVDKGIPLVVSLRGMDRSRDNDEIRLSKDLITKDTEGLLREALTEWDFIVSAMNSL